MFSNSLQAAAMERSLSALWQKQQLIAHNIANNETPEYKAKRLSFETVFQKELLQVQKDKELTAREKAQQIRAVRSQVYEDESVAIRADGNNVDVVAEQIEFTRAQLQYDALQQRINRHYKTLQYAISGGR